jgi:hypothetical protein
MKAQIERELLEEMTLFPPQPNQASGAPPMPKPVEFTQEEIERSLQDPWVRANILIPHVAALPKFTPKRERIDGLRADVPF